MPWAIVTVMLVASLAVALFVSWPLLVSKPEQETEGIGGEESAVDQLLVQKEAVYSAIKELEFDHAMGNLSEDDYRELARRYEDRAVALLQTIDEASREEDGMRGSVEPPAVAGVMLGRARVTSPEDAIEQEVAAIRAKRHARHGRGHDLEDEIEAQVAAVRAAKRGVAPGVARADAPPVVAAAASCPSCKATVTNPVAAFCSKCGASLREKCPTCGATVDGGDEFCSACGTSLVGGNGKVGKTVLGGANA